MTRIAVIGASGFVGSAVVDAARSAGHDTLSLSGPRLATAGTTHEDVITALAAQLGDVDVVVNCAGRTRSIIGAQSLLNLGFSQRIVALENGTQGWTLAGFELERGSSPKPLPSACIMKSRPNSA